jgi:hypothetical protein
MCQALRWSNFANPGGKEGSNTQLGRIWSRLFYMRTHGCRCTVLVPDGANVAKERSETPSGLEELKTEMSQLHYRKTIKPIFADSMTRQQKSQALRYLMFLKEKRCGRIKALEYADGRKQRLWKTKETTSSPNVRTHSLYLTAVIAALEGRKVVTVDIPGAFMQTDIDELIHVKLEDELVDVLLMVDNK